MDRMTPPSKGNTVDEITRCIDFSARCPIFLALPHETCGRDRHSVQGVPAPKEQPPRNLSGKRTAG